MYLNCSTEKKLEFLNQAYDDLKLLYPIEPTGFISDEYDRYYEYLIKISNIMSFNSLRLDISDNQKFGFVKEVTNYWIDKSATFKDKKNLIEFGKLKEPIDFLMLKYKIKANNKEKIQHDDSNDQSFQCLLDDLKKVSSKSRFFFEINLFITIYYCLIKDDIDTAYKQIVFLIDELEKTKNMMKSNTDLVIDIYFEYIRICIKMIEKHKLTDNEIDRCLRKSCELKEKYNSIELRMFYLELNNNTKNNEKVNLEQEYEKIIKEFFYSKYSLKHELELVTNSIKNCDYKKSIEKLNDLIKKYEKNFSSNAKESLSDETKDHKLFIVRNLIECYFESKEYTNCKNTFEKYEQFLVDSLGKSDRFDKLRLVIAICLIMIDDFSTAKKYNRV
ncbi:unnamed protein product [Brachionus calyciflorus]|uniref:Uncharacterized protein n=1 Tax=Brachionus calyciflorus TaxID=104777 RepID=A0A814L7B8_9BILA|nr:unnamed protein product [Brachionus calyciflorus]